MERGRGRTAQSRTAHSLPPPHPAGAGRPPTPFPRPPPPPRLTDPVPLSNDDDHETTAQKRRTRKSRPLLSKCVQSKKGRGLFPRGRWPMDILCKRPADTSHRRHPCRHIWTESFKPCVNLTSCHAFIAAFITAAAAVQTVALPHTASSPSSNQEEPLAASSRFFSSLPGAADGLPV